MSHHASTDTVVHPSRSFSDQWPEIAEAVGRAFRMDTQELTWLKKKPVAKLIGAIPFLAGCDQPARTAVAHLGTYILSIRETKPFFNADPTDDGDILDRLRLIMNFRGGDAEIIDKGMALLALNMLDDYKQDIQIDSALGKYNPVTSGAIDYEVTREELVNRVTPSSTEAVDEYSEIGPIVRGPWGGD